MINHANKGTYLREIQAHVWYQLLNHSYICLLRLKPFKIIRVDVASNMSRHFCKRVLNMPKRVISKFFLIAFLRSPVLHWRPEDKAAIFVRFVQNHSSVAKKPFNSFQRNDDATVLSHILMMF